MKRTLSVLLAVALLLTTIPAAFSAGAVAEAIPNGNYKRPAVTAANIVNRPDIDGKLDDDTWQQATKFPFTKDSLMAGDGLLWSYPEGGGYTELPEDGDGDAYIAWDSEYVYFALEIVDEEHENNQVQGYDLWRGDCLQLQIGHSQKSLFDDSARFELGFAYNDRQDRQLGFRWTDTSGLGGDFLRAGSAVDMSKGAGADYYYFVGRDDDTYTTTYEIALKHAWLGGDGLTAGDKFMFSFALHLQEDTLPPACLANPEAYSGYHMEWAQGLVTGKTLSEAGIITCGEAKECAHARGTVLVGYVEETCVKAGYTGDQACRDCGYVAPEGYGEEIPAHETEIRNVKEATCSEKGNTGDLWCCVCQQVVRCGDAIMPLPHSYGNDKICDNCGYEHKEFFFSNVEQVGTDTYDVTIHYQTNKRLSNGVFEVHFDPDAFELAGQPSSDLKNAEINIANRKNGEILVGFMNPATEQDIQDAIEFGGSEDDVFPKTGRALQMKLRIKESTALDVGKLTIETRELMAMDGECAEVAQPLTMELPLHIHSYDNACDPDCNGCGEVREVSHTYDGACDPYCNVCNTIRIVSHIRGTDNVCAVCGYRFTDDEFFSIVTEPVGEDSYKVRILFDTDKRLSNGVFNVLFDADVLELSGMPTSGLKNSEVNITNRQNGVLVVGFMNPATEQDIQDAIDFGGSEDDVFPKTGCVLEFTLRIKAPSMAKGRLMVATRELVALDGACANTVQPLATELSLHIHTYTDDFDTTCNSCSHVREPLRLRGDADGNGRVDSTDARLTLQYAVQKISAEDLALDAADVDGSGTVDSTDARLILQYAVQKIGKFPVEE